MTYAIRGTIVISLMAYTAGEWMRMRAGHGHAAAARGLWTLAVLLSIVHTAAAFQYRYHWSHAAAAADGAAQMAAVIGRGWAGAPWVNYAFLALWAGDAARWWRRGADAARDTMRSAMSGIILFMFVNGAIIFAHGPIRPLGIAATAIVLTAWVRRVRR